MSPVRSVVTPRSAGLVWLARRHLTMSPGTGIYHRNGDSPTYDVTPCGLWLAELQPMRLSLAMAISRPCQRCFPRG